MSGVDLTVTEVLGWMKFEQDCKHDLADRLHQQEAENWRLRAANEINQRIVNRLLSNLNDPDLEGLDRDDSMTSMLIDYGLAVVCKECVMPHRADTPCPTCAAGEGDDDE